MLLQESERISALKYVLLPAFEVHLSIVSQMSDKARFRGHLVYLIWYVLL